MVQKSQVNTLRPFIGYKTEVVKKNNVQEKLTKLMSKLESFKEQNQLWCFPKKLVSVLSWKAKFGMINWLELLFCYKPPCSQGIAA